MSDLMSENFDSIKDSAYLLMVADGIGGSDFGEYAARLVIHKIWELGAHSVSWVMGLENLHHDEIQERIDAYAEVLQFHIDKESHYPGYSLDMGTTITAGYLVGREAVISNVGDSRAYLFRDGDLRQLTEDQTLARKMIRAGHDPEKVSDFHRILANYFGTGLSHIPDVEIHHFEFQNDDRLLLCTDGLFRELSHAEICDHISQACSPQEICDQMLSKALERGGRDNITLIVAEIEA